MGEYPLFIIGFLEMNYAENVIKKLPTIYILLKQYARYKPVDQINLT